MKKVSLTCHGCGKEFSWEEMHYAATGEDLEEGDATAMAEGEAWYRILSGAMPSPAGRWTMPPIDLSDCGGNDIPNEVQVDFDEVKAATDRAVLIRIDNEEYWIPKSQIGDVEQKRGRFATGGWLTIPEWLAEEKGLV